MWIRISETKHDTYEAADAARQTWRTREVKGPPQKCRVRKRTTHYSCIVWEERPSPFGPKPEAADDPKRRRQDSLHKASEKAKGDAATIAKLRQVPRPSPSLIASMLLGVGLSPTTQNAIDIVAQHEVDEHRRRLTGGE